MEATTLVKDFFYKKENMASCICVGEQWKLEWASEEFTALIDAPLKQLQGKSLLQNCMELSLVAVSDEIIEAREGQLISYYQSSIFYGMLWYWIDKEQGKRFVTMYTLPMKQITKKSLLSWKELDKLFDSMHDGIWVIDGKGITVRVNKAMERIAGVRAADVIGQHVTAAMDLGLTSTCVTLRALEKKKPVTMFDDYSNGTRCLNTSTPIFDEHGKPWRVIACIRDISELDTLEKKLNKAEMEAKIYRDKLRSLEKSGDTYYGKSPIMVSLEKDLARAGNVDAPVLLLGETGTGKTMSANRIHNCSKRKEHAFITLNCGAIPAELLEAELFGYEHGAFSGASEKGKPGMFELADKGTLFLDEIAELPLHMQVKLLHVLDGSGYRRLGGTKLFTPNVRIIAATNKSIEDLIRENKFREDLYYRLRVLVITIPPLRKRAEDIPFLISLFLDEANKKYGLYKTMSQEVHNVLLRNTWPGNVRELRASIELLVAMSEKDRIVLADVPQHFLPKDCPNFEHAMPINANLKEAVEELETRLIRNALLECKSTYKAAKKLGVSQSTVVRKAQRYNITSSTIAHENN